MRSKCRAEGLERPVYIGLGVGLPISLVDGLPSNVTGGYTAGRMADIGSLWSVGPGTMVLEGAPEL